MSVLFSPSSATATAELIFKPGFGKTSCDQGASWREIREGIKRSHFGLGKGNVLVDY